MRQFVSEKGAYAQIVSTVPATLAAGLSDSPRLYYEAQRASGLFGMFDPGYVDTPTGYACFPKDDVTPPEEWLRRCCYNLTRYTTFDRGGHFAALERPEDLVAEIREFFRPLRA